MTKTTEELMHAFEIARSRLDGMNQSEEIPWQAYDELTDMLDGLKASTQSEIEAAEAAKENEIFAKLDALQEEHHIKAEAARGKDDSTFMHHNRIEGHLSYAKLRLREEIPNQT